MAATYAEQRMEKMRPAACNAGQRVNGTDTLYRGSNWVSINSWSFTDEGNSYYHLRVVTRSKTIKNQTRTDTLEMGVPCVTQ